MALRGRGSSLAPPSAPRVAAPLRRRRALVVSVLCLPLALRHVGEAVSAFAVLPILRGPRCHGPVQSRLVARAATLYEDVAPPRFDDSFADEESFAAQARALVRPRAGPSDVELHLNQTVGLAPGQLAKVRKFWASRPEDMMPLVEKSAQVVDFLKSNEMNLTREEVRGVIADCPRVLDVFSVETLREKVRFLREEARVEGRDLAAVLAAYPQVFDRSVATTLRPALEFWIGAMGMPPEQMAAVLKHMPAQVWCKPQTMRPKWNFAEEVMGLKYQDILDLETPFFRLSLDKTIAPRHFFLLRKNVSGLPLQKVLGTNDKAFSTEAAKCDPAEYRQWLAEEWPATEEARTIAWVKPRSSPRASGGYGGQRRSWRGNKWRDGERRDGERRDYRGGRGWGGRRRGSRPGRFGNWRQRREERQDVGFGEDRY
mmetsp:Transcript_113159/g.361213  ORF Transcript_113159/g.361213 Transcript_113159/m.361213 type:complete len:428 (+) Transcript_113159:56-1339(+)